VDLAEPPAPSAALRVNRGGRSGVSAGIEREPRDIGPGGNHQVYDADTLALAAALEPSPSPLCTIARIMGTSLPDFNISSNSSLDPPIRR